jgi:hypothetical protein
MTTKMRNRNKIAFIKKHKNYASEVFKEVDTLVKSDLDIKDSEIISDFIKLARIELGYSPKTYHKDILYSLKYTYKKVFG